MALRLRRGTDAERQQPGFIPESGELIYTTDTKLVYVGDGVTGGGLPISSGAFATSLVTDLSPQLGGDLDLNSFQITGDGAVDINGAIDTSGDITSATTVSAPTVTTDTLAGQSSNPVSLGSNLDLNNNNIVGIGNINVDGTITATGSISLGDSTEDSVSLEGLINSNLVPQTDSLYNIGTASFKWQAGWFNVLDATTLNANSVTIGDVSINGDSGTITAPNLLVDVLYSDDSSVLYDSATNKLTVATMTGTFVATDLSIMIDPDAKSVTANEMTSETLFVDTIDNPGDSIRLRSSLVGSQSQVTIETTPASTDNGNFLSAGGDWQALVLESINEGGDIASGDVLGVITWSGLQSSTETEVSNAMGVQADPAGTTTSTHIPTKYVWLNQPAVEGNSPVAMSFDSLGRLAINQQNASATLDVNGFAKLAILDTPPSSPENGSIAIADGAGWDPLGINAQQVVTYLDGVWKEFSSSTTVDGDITGSVFGDDSTVLVDGVNGLIVGDVVNSSVTTETVSFVPYTDAASRDTAIGVPTAGQVVYVADTNELQVYNGDQWSNIGGTSKTVDDVAGTTYTVAATDLGNVLTFRDAGSVTVTLPDAASTAIPVGGYVEIVNMDNTNPITVDGTASQVVSKEVGAPSIPGFGSVRAIKLSTSEWLVTGDTA